MNYYEHHLGDYMRDTAHLSLLEDGAYRRLLDAYYTREKPLPPDLRDCCKLARASTKPERDAVAYVLREFFERRDDGHYQKRADEEIAKFRAKSEKARASINARWERTRNVSGATGERNTNVSPTGYERSTDDKHRAPVPTHQSPVPSNQSSHTTTSALAARAPERVADPPDPPPSPPPAPEPTSAAAATLAMRAAGLADANPAHPTLLALLQAGVTDTELAGAAAVAVGKGKGFAYALAVADGWRRDAVSAGAAVAGAPRPMPGASPPVRLSAYERELAAKRRQWEQMTGRTHPDNLPQQPPPMAEVIDITPAVPLLAKGAP
jgi:uncharacterized protein YdaU (DUF1376 family)